MRRAERGVEDRGSRIEEPRQVLHPLDPDGAPSHSTRRANNTRQVAGYRSSIPDPAFLQRVRWRSRRGLLELDIVLGRFIDAHYAQLDESEKMAFEALLDMPDNPLWDMIAGRQEATHTEQQALLEKIRAV